MKTWKKQRILVLALAVAAAVLTVLGQVALASSVTIPNTFTSGTTAQASQVNANFSAVQTAVNDNNSRISALEAFYNSGVETVAHGGTNATTVGSAGSVAYSTGTAYSFSAAGTSGQVLSSGETGAPTWVTPSGGGSPVGTGVFSGANTFTGANTFSSTSNSFTGNGAGLTDLNASNLASGTVASNRVAGAYPGITDVGPLSTLSVSGTVTTGLHNNIKVVRLRSTSVASTIATAASVGEVLRNGDNWSFRINRFTTATQPLRFVIYRNGVRSDGSLTGVTGCSTPPTCGGSLTTSCCVFDTSTDTDPRDLRVLIGAFSTLTPEDFAEAVLLNTGGPFTGYVTSTSNQPGL